MSSSRCRGEGVEAAQVHLLFSRLQAACPKPTTELRYLSPFELLVAVILSAQSTDKKSQRGHRPAVSARQYSTSVAGFG